MMHSKITPADTIGCKIDSVQAQDPDFWAAYRKWRAMEDNAIAACRVDEGKDEHTRSLLDESAEARIAMLSYGVRTASAVSVKMAVLAEGPADCLVYETVKCGLTVFEVLQADIERLAMREIYNLPDGQR